MDGRARVGADARFVADLVDLDFTAPATPGARVTLDDFAVVNLSGAYAVTETVEIYGRVENLLDADYQEVQGYEAPGLAAFAGLRARF